MAEQRLQMEGIPCLIRSLLGGPGLWGTAYNLPHELLVYEGDESYAREVLQYVPQEMIEREQKAKGLHRSCPNGWSPQPSLPSSHSSL